MSYRHPADVALRAGIRRNDPSAMKELARALRMADGQLDLAARTLNCTRFTINDMRRKYPHVQAMVQGGWQK